MNGFTAKRRDLKLGADSDHFIHRGGGDVFVTNISPHLLSYSGLQALNKVGEMRCGPWYGQSGNFTLLDNPNCPVESRSPQDDWALLHARIIKNYGYLVLIVTPDARNSHIHNYKSQWLYFNPTYAMNGR